MKKKISNVKWKQAELLLGLEMSTIRLKKPSPLQTIMRGLPRGQACFWPSADRHLETCRFTESFDVTGRTYERALSELNTWELGKTTLQAPISRVERKWSPGLGFLARNWNISSWLLACPVLLCSNVQGPNLMLPYISSWLWTHVDGGSQSLPFLFPVGGWNQAKRWALTWPSKNFI